MKEEVKIFVEDYNKKIQEVDLKIRESLKDQLKDPRLADMLDDYIGDEIITPENVDLVDAEVYEYENHRLELQAFNNKTLQHTYWWTTPTQTVEEYRKNRLKIIGELLSDNIDTLKKNIDDAKKSLDVTMSAFRVIILS